MRERRFSSASVTAARSVGHAYKGTLVIDRKHWMVHRHLAQVLVLASVLGAACGGTAISLDPTVLRADELIRLGIPGPLESSENSGPLGAVIDEEIKQGCPPKAEAMTDLADLQVSMQTMSYFHRPDAAAMIPAWSVHFTTFSGPAKMEDVRRISQDAEPCGRWQWQLQLDVTQHFIEETIASEPIAGIPVWVTEQVFGDGQGGWETPLWTAEAVVTTPDGQALQVAVNVDGKAGGASAAREALEAILTS
jgi:hypothetical protein